MKRIKPVIPSPSTTRLLEFANSIYPSTLWEMHEHPCPRCRKKVKTLKEWNLMLESGLCADCTTISDGLDFHLSYEN